MSAFAATHTFGDDTLNKSSIFGFPTIRAMMQKRAERQYGARQLNPDNTLVFRRSIKHQLQELRDASRKVAFTV
ncbi:MAG: hypothetical protein K1X83_12295 [Oligoflexia bacterium]|nr:hypothetical protein [Oligoflexia bacterium]